MNFKFVLFCISLSNTSFSFRILKNNNSNHRTKNKKSEIKYGRVYTCTYFRRQRFPLCAQVTFNQSIKAVRLKMEEIFKNKMQKQQQGENERNRFGSTKINGKEREKRERRKRSEIFYSPDWYWKRTKSSESYYGISCNPIHEIEFIAARLQHFMLFARAHLTAFSLKNRLSLDIN